MLLMFAIPAVSAEDTGDIDVTSDIGAINSIDDVATEISSELMMLLLKYHLMMRLVYKQTFLHQVILQTCRSL